MSTPTPNYSIYAIPAFYILALLPQAYAGILLASHGRRLDNANPRSTLHQSSLQKSVPPHIYARFERAKGAHINALETLPLFAAAVICANMARLSPGTLNTVCGLFLALRVAHVGFYVGVETRRWSFARTGVWVAGVGCCFFLLVRAGGVFVEGRV